MERLLSLFLLVILMGIKCLSQDIELQPVQERIDAEKLSGFSVIAAGWSDNGTLGVALGPRMMAVGPYSAGTSLRLLCFDRGSVVAERSVEALPHPVALGGSWAMYCVRSGTKIVTRKIDILTGAVRDMFDDIQPFDIGVDGDSIALVGQSASGQELRIIGGPESVTVQKFSLPFGTLAGPLLQNLSISGSKAVLADAVNASFITLDFSSNSLKVGNRYELRGREIGRSRDWPATGPSGGRVTIIAQKARHEGGIVALLAPYKKEEGYRMAVYDSTGSQTQSFKLRTAFTGSERASFRPAAVIIRSTAVIVVSDEGTIRKYEVPAL